MEKKILIAEDEQFLRELYADVLRGEGYTVDTAIDGEEAFTKMSKGGWDLVLLDIIMPNISGLDVMKKMQSSPQPEIPNKTVVFLTNLDKGEEIKQALLLGNGYLIKSQITPGDLVHEVQLYLSQPTPPTK
ncbi:MAG: response regulator [Candidatus Levybacteria bacterium]|nr:response regulator [Candidatus Levybacteria bacterium]